MTTVYVVTSGQYSDFRIEAIFSTKELAEIYIKNNSDPEAEYCYNYNISEYVLDEDREKITKFENQYVADINLETGALIRQSSYRSRQSSTSENSFVYPTTVRGWSTQSPEHALKLAIERRQAHLRAKTEGIK